MGGSLSESIDSSITAITFTEYNLTSDADQSGDDASDDATDNDFVGENENFPFGDDMVSTQRLLTNQRVTLYILMELCSTTLQEYLDQRLVWMKPFPCRFSLKFCWVFN